jgi:hypothetical protein
MVPKQPSSVREGTTVSGYWIKPKTMIEVTFMIFGWGGGRGRRGGETELLPARSEVNVSARSRG